MLCQITPMSNRLASCSTNSFIQCARRALSTKPTTSDVEVPPVNPNLHRGKDQRDITNMDLLEERIRQRAAVREMKIGDQVQRWNYRSELVNKHDLDKNHRNTWIAYFFIIIVGFGAFVTVKSQVVMGRKEEMEAREQLRRELKLTGVDRKKIAIVEN
ncbi:unnamed protein product [Caenorhabditis auriculariae]|uniref:Uncharacterized protein n=1 Tax=Caenorhabditis auriculariae TaxID=2777116 RepID=A0A8S1HG18_9PELO|nr:unnamed protein product [Caenorhabditis auriculariae]